MSKTPFLNEQELANPIVRKILDELEARLDKYRKMNDHTDCDPLLRGRIQEVKLLQIKINSKPKR
jgi:hypothetical protein